MEAVSVPAGLSNRIIERLHAAGVLNDNVATVEVTVPTAVETTVLTAVETTVLTAVETTVHPAITPGPRRVNRRRFVAASVLAVAAAILVAVFFSDLFGTSSDVPWEVMADRWQESLNPQADAWRDAEKLPRGYAVPPGILGTLDGWQPLNSRPGVAIRLVRGDGTVAMLYAVRGTATALPAGPPARPQSTTGGKSVGYWQSNGVIYVLVAPGDERLYRQFVSPSATPLA